MRSIDDVQIRFIVPAACVHYISYNLQYLNINYSVVKATLHPIIGISNKPPQTFIALSYDELSRVKTMTFYWHASRKVNRAAVEAALGIKGECKRNRGVPLK